MEAGMTDQYHLINWNNLPDSSKITMLRDRTDQLTTQLHQLTTQVRQLTGQVQQLASGFATMQAGLNEMQARLDDVAPVRSRGGGGSLNEPGFGGG
jgi:X-X-X-Leu-X-X-Gly heptad repeat protein